MFASEYWLTTDATGARIWRGFPFPGFFYFNATRGTTDTCFKLDFTTNGDTFDGPAQYCT